MNNIEPASSSDLLLVGKVIRPHGLNGLLKLKAYAGSETSLLNAGIVFLRTASGETRNFSVSSVKPHKNIFLMDVEEVNSVDEAEAYRGADIFIKKEALTREEDDYFWYELLGLKVYLDTGECLGSISRIIPTKGTDIYVIKKGEKEAYIPAVFEVIKEIDLENGTMTISPMEGMLDLNEV
ncbi:MAG: 16S rRNA processing protein RimM [Deltaproteobacteria bacterium]|nr:16S rRNA processing protein RimM [Deltaproteobacteria bacterium]MBW2142965.1 16S rRNA processing protein RimM [Deltaproteobacteria bacterium]